MSRDPSPLIVLAVVIGVAAGLTAHHVLLAVTCMIVLYLLGCHT